MQLILSVLLPPALQLFRQIAIKTVQCVVEQRTENASFYVQMKEIAKLWLWRLLVHRFSCSI